MKRGEEARAKVYENIKEAFGENFVGVFDKKIYVWAEEGAEKIQFSITITMPKNPMVSNVNPTNDSEVNVTSEAPPRKMDYSPEEEEKIKKLMEELNL